MNKKIKRLCARAIYRAGWLGVIALSLLPLPVGYCISDLLTVIATRFRKITKTSKLNIKRAFPEWGYQEVDATCEKYIRGCIDYVFEFFRYRNMSVKSVQRRCTFHNVELLSKAFEDHKFVICYSGHMQNYEFTTSLPLHLDGYGMCHLYLASRPNCIQNWILKTRSRFGAVNIPTGNSLRDIIRIKNELDSPTSKYKGYVFGTLADMDTVEATPHVTSFFGHKLEVLTGSERIGRKYGMKFVFAEITRPARGEYNITFREILPPDENVPYAYTDEFIRMLEANIRLQPELWFLWGEPRF